MELRGRSRDPQGALSHHRRPPVHLTYPLDAIDSSSYVHMHAGVYPSTDVCTDTSVHISTSVHPGTRIHEYTHEGGQIAWTPTGSLSSEQHNSKLSTYSQLMAEQTPNLEIRAGPGFLHSEGKSLRICAAFSLAWTSSVLLRLVFRHSTQ